MHSLQILKTVWKARVKQQAALVCVKKEFRIQSCYSNTKAYSYYNRVGCPQEAMLGWKCRDILKGHPQRGTNRI